MRSNPPLPIINAPVIRAVFQVGANGQLYETVFDFIGNLPGTPSLGDLQAFITSISTNASIQFLACLPQTSTWTQLIVSEIAIGTTPTAVAIVGSAGTVATDGDTSTVAAVLTKYTAVKGQHGRGRNYMPTLPGTFTNDAVDPNRLTAAAVAIYTTFIGAILLPIDVGGIEYNLCVSTRPNPPNTLTRQAAPVVNMVVQPLLGTVRRRREGRGQ